MQVMAEAAQVNNLAVTVSDLRPLEEKNAGWLFVAAWTHCFRGAPPTIVLRLMVFWDTAVSVPLHLSQ